jgi:2-polyprenyl-3-methyl-5-hydroxy-6-metoxy-1,4-benzoquinol methylase
MTASFIGKMTAEADYPCWCGARSAQRVCHQSWGRRPFLVLRCLSCQTHRILPRALQDAASVEGLYNHYEAPFSENEVSALAHSILQRCAEVGVVFGADKAVLDVGCGHGAVLNALCEQFGCAGLGVDVDQRRIDYARAHATRARFGRGLFQARDLDRQYDIILCNAVIEHVLDPVAFLRELAAALAPGGSLFVLTPNAASLAYRLLGSWWRELLSIGEHIYLFSPESLARCADAAGLRTLASATAYDRSPAGLRFDGARQALISGWWLYRQGVKRAAQAFSGRLRGDILYTRLQQVGDTGRAP